MQSDMPWSRGPGFLPAGLQKAGAILALAVSCSAAWGFPATETPDLRVYIAGSSAQDRQIEGQPGRAPIHLGQRADPIGQGAVGQAQPVHARAGRAG